MQALINHFLMSLGDRQSSTIRTGKNERLLKMDFYKSTKRFTLNNGQKSGECIERDSMRANFDKLPLENVRPVLCP